MNNEDHRTKQRARERQSGVWMVLYILLIVLHLSIPASTQRSNCDVTIDVNASPLRGNFTSPNYPHSYGNGLRCTYHFIGRPNQRVQIKFDVFAVKGVPPSCSHDYVDIYTQARRPDEDVLSVPLHGRYCGNSLDELPHLLISMHEILILVFFSDGSKVDHGFKGIYEFIDASRYTVGTPAIPPLCGQTVNGSLITHGNLLSPTYPGVYPDNIDCFYKIHAHPGQRIKLTFVDLDLYSGGDHCPFDSVAVYDGPTSEDEKIGTYCGKRASFDVFSTHHALHVHFVTKSGRLEPTKRPYLNYWDIASVSQVTQKGFNISFVVSEDFVDLSFIQGEHIPGSECDQRVYSEGENSGWVMSPSYPSFYPLGITCYYFIDGLVNRQNLEKTRLTFTDMDIPYDRRRCDEGVVLAYLSGQTVKQIHSPLGRATPDRSICGSDSLPGMLETTVPRMMLIFNTSKAQMPGRGFNATYQFVTDYAIEGTPASEQECHFIYRSTSAKQGVFNSPRHPSNYPNNIQCKYEFIGMPGEHVRFTFGEFDVDNRGGGCSTDYLVIYEVHDDLSERLISKTCGNKMPGPVMAKSHQVYAMFYSDSSGFNSGFDAKYEFLPPAHVDKRCTIENITSGGGGIIHSPNHPHKYQLNTCREWHIYASFSNAHILLIFESFVMEGSIKEEGRGCANAALKIYTNHTSLPQYVICGRALDVKEITSQQDFIRVQFISAQRAQGAKGFKITWTEILPNLGVTGDAFCDGFRCAQTKYCIASHLKCNRVRNCGIEDLSDENPRDCSRDYTSQSVLHVILGVVMALVVLVFLLVCLLHRRRKMKKRRNRKEIEVRYVTRSAVANNHHNNSQNYNNYAQQQHMLCNNHSGDGYNHSGGYIDDSNYPSPERTLLREKTEKVSIV